MPTDAGELVALGTSAPLVLKVLGPTADYVGSELQGWTRRRIQNVQRIFERAEQRLGEKLDEPGAVPPRVLREMLEQGSYWDDELGAHYFGGLLASSRSQDSLDDRAAALAALVGRLSVYQVRTHYVLYVNAHRLLRDSGITLTINTEVAQKGQVFVPFSAWVAAVRPAEDESEDLDWNSIIQHAFAGLQREGLVHEDFFLATWSSSRKRAARSSLRGDWCSSQPS